MWQIMPSARFWTLLLALHRCDKLAQSSVWLHSAADQLMSSYKQMQHSYIVCMCSLLRLDSSPRNEHMSVTYAASVFWVLASESLLRCALCAFTCLTHVQPHPPLHINISKSQLSDALHHTHLAYSASSPPPDPDSSGHPVPNASSATWFACL